VYSSLASTLAFHRYGKLTCHMGSHSVNCHPTEVRIPPLPPAEAGTRFSDPGGMQGWVYLCYVKADRPGIEPAIPPAGLCFTDVVRLVRQRVDGSQHGLLR